MDRTAWQKWPQLTDNPWVLYGRWNLTADPLWFQYRSVLTCYMAWLETGDQQYLDLACADYVMMPDVSAGQAIVHLGEIGYLRDYLLVKPHQTDERNAEWERRLKALGDHCLGNVRIGDFDQCATYVSFWRNLDKHLGTTYSQLEQVQGVAEWVDKFMALDTFQGGPRDASSEYELSTIEILALGVWLYGDDLFSWWNAFATEYAKFLPASISQDYGESVAWGDQQGDNGGKVHPYHRTQVCILLAGLGYDPEGRLLSLAKRMLGSLTSHPHSVYPYGGMGLQLLCDPERIMAAPDVPLEDCLHVGQIGITVCRELETYLTTVFGHSVRPDGTWLELEDHHFRGAWAFFSWRYQGKQVLTQPFGYGIGANDFHQHNAPCLKNQGWFWQRRFLGTEVTPTGFISRGEMFGPNQTYWQSIEPNGWTAPDAFTNCRLTTSLEYNRTMPSFTITESWTSDGQFFPEGTADLPVHQRCQYALGPIRDEGGTLAWEVDGQPVRASYELTDGNGNPVAAKVVPGETVLANSKTYYRVFLQAPKDLYAGTLKMVFTLADQPPPVLDIPVSGVIRGKQLIIDLP
jgi:hypothetical protein